MAAGSSIALTCSERALTEREAAYMVEREWARTADDLLWRRTKCGLGADAAAREALAAFVGA